MKETKFSVKKKILASASMLTVSAIMLSSATYAWFTMSTEVSVTGMNVKATAADGLLITDTTVTADRVWATSKDIGMTGYAELAPTNTANGTAWCSAKSDLFDNAMSEQTATGAYTTLGSFTYTAPDSGSHWMTGEGIGSITGTDSSVTNYVLLKNFYIKSSGDTAWSKDLTVEEVTATIDTTNLSGEGDAAAKAKQDDLYKSLRVLLVVGNESFIYAPITGYDNSIKYQGTGTNLTLVPSTTQSVFTAVNTIPVGDVDGINVKMYIYFEGEDDNCKSSNISGIALNYVTVSARFGVVDNA
jgi:hypothetical protein